MCCGEKRRTPPRPTPSAMSTPSTYRRMRPHAPIVATTATGRPTSRCISCQPPRDSPTPEATGRATLHERLPAVVPNAEVVPPPRAHPEQTRLGDELVEEFHAKRDGDGDAGDARLRDEDVPEDGAIAVVGDVTPEGCRSAQGKPLRGIDLVRRAVHDFRDGTTVLVEHVAGVRRRCDARRNSPLTTTPSANHLTREQSRERIRRGGGADSVKDSGPCASWEDWISTRRERRRW